MARKKYELEVYNAVVDAELTFNGGDNLPLLDDALGRLTSNERRLLVVLANPASVGLNKGQICEMAGIGYSVYYNAFKKHHFIALNNKLALAMLKQEIGPLINTGIKRAHEGSFLHWKVLMEMAGLYNAKTGHGYALKPEDSGTDGEIVVRFASNRMVEVDNGVRPEPEDDENEDNEGGEED